MYSDALLARFLDPTRAGDLADPSGTGAEGNITCGDVVHVSVRVEDGIIRSASFRAQGCAVAIAGADALCELVTGMSVTAAHLLELAAISDALGGIPEDRSACVDICLGALRGALDEVRSKPLATGSGQV